jgi:hypothetical protein
MIAARLGISVPAGWRRFGDWRAGDRFCGGRVGVCSLRRRLYLPINAAVALDKIGDRWADRGLWAGRWMGLRIG